jgi:hypothetical protein
MATADSPRAPGTAPGSALAGLLKGSCIEGATVQDSPDESPNALLSDRRQSVAGMGVRTVSVLHNHRLYSGAQLALAVALLIAVGCGSAPGGSATQPPTATAATGTQAPIPTQAVASQPPAPGGELSNLCLNTPAEVAAALGVPEPTATNTPNPGFGGVCSYNDAAGQMVYSIGISPVTASTDALALARQNPAAVDIPGIADEAVLASQYGPLLFRRGSWLVSAGANPTLQIFADPAAYRTALESLARTAATRL